MSKINNRKSVVFENVSTTIKERAGNGFFRADIDMIEESTENVEYIVETLRDNGYRVIQGLNSRKKLNIFW